MEQYVQVWLEKGWDHATVKLLDGNGKVTKEYNGTDAEEAFRMLGEDIDREAHS